MSVSLKHSVECVSGAIPAPKPTAPPVTRATLPLSRPCDSIVTGVVSDVVGGLLRSASGFCDAILNLGLFALRRSVLPPLARLRPVRIDQPLQEGELADLNRQVL